MKIGLLRKLNWVKPSKPHTKSGKEFLKAMTGRAAVVVESALDLGFPEPPTPMTVVNEARFLLKAAAEIEHSLLVQYLYAYYSVKSDTIASRAQAGVLRQIAIEEMGHLITVQNLLLAIGGGVYMDRESLLVGYDTAGDYPFPFKLEALSSDSLAKYVTTESPPLELLPDKELRKKLKPIFDQADAALGGLTLNHVGLLFMKLFWLFQPSDTPHKLWPDILAPLLPAGRHLQDSDFDFAESNPKQGTPGEFNTIGDSSLIVKVIGARDDAMFAIDAIAEQGEGWQLGADSGSPRPSHFERFLGVYDAFTTALAGHVFPVPVIPNTRRNAHPDDPEKEAGRITHPAALLWAKLGNARYQILVCELVAAVDQKSSDDDGSAVGRSSLITTAIYVEMMTSIGGIARKLVQLALKDGGDATTAAAAMPFELPATGLPTTWAKALEWLRKLLDESVPLIAAIRALTGVDKPTNDDKMLLDDIEASDDALRPLLPAP